MAKVNVYSIEGDRFLYIDGKLCMWDTPVERKEQALIAEEAFGDVLLAGYGFGLCQRELLRNPHVEHVRTIELYSEVIAEAKRHNGIVFGEIEIGNFFGYDCVPPSWDCVVGDIWQEVEEVYLPDYLKFRKVAERVLKPGGKVLGWGIEFFEWLRQKEVADG